MQSVLHYVSL
jgi:hypothetical protein